MASNSLQTGFLVSSVLLCPIDAKGQNNTQTETITPALIQTIETTKETELEDA